MKLEIKKRLSNNSLLDLLRQTSRTVAEPFRVAAKLIFAMVLMLIVAGAFFWALAAITGVGVGKLLSSVVLIAVARMAGKVLEGLAELVMSFYKNSKERAEKPPFSLLLEISEELPPKYSQNLEQEISDLRMEYSEALMQNKIWRARFIVLDYYEGLIWSVIKWIMEWAKKIVGFTPHVN